MGLRETERTDGGRSGKMREGGGGGGGEVERKRQRMG